jgi:hypothetical protein
VHPTYEGEVTIHKYRNTCCSKKLSYKLKLAHCVVLKIEAIVQVNYMKPCVYPINISQVMFPRFTQRDSTLAQGGLTCVTVADGGVGVRSLLLVGAPCSSGSTWGPVSIHVGGGGGDAARRGEVGALPHRCSLLLSGGGGKGVPSRR